MAPAMTVHSFSSQHHNHPYKPNLEIKIHRNTEKVGFSDGLINEGSKGVCSSALSTYQEPIIASVSTTCREGLWEERTDGLQGMAKEDFLVDSDTYASILEMCVKMKSLRKGKQTHAHMLKNGYEGRMPLGSRLVTMYVKCGSPVNARLVLDRMQKRDLFSCTPLIGEYARQGRFEEVLALFYQMQSEGVRPDDLVFSIVVKACAALMGLDEGSEIHAYIIKTGFESDVYVASALIDMYAKCKSLHYARQVFDKMPQRNAVSWNAMIAGYAQNGNGNEALRLFLQMQLAGEKPNVNTWTAVIAGHAQNGRCDEALNVFCQMQLADVKPNSATISSVLRACARLEALEKGKQIHGYAIRKGFELDVFVGSALVDMYSKCWCIDDARQMFEKMSLRNVVSWNAIIAGYAQHGNVDEVMKLFCQMRLAGLTPNLITWNILITGLAHNGQCDEALEVFDQMQLEDLKPNVISWTAVISGYARNGQGNDALKLLHQMQLAGVKPNSNCIAGVLCVCAELSDLRQGKEIHGYIIRSGFESDVFVGSAVVDMYAKCGSIKDARYTFDKMSLKNVVTWNSMIAGYALTGRIADALVLFDQMQLAGMEPDNFTWNALIAGHAQNRQSDEALKLFSQMQLAGIQPNVVSWTTIIAGYAQNGHGNEALKLFRHMQLTSVKPNTVSIASVVRACSNLASLKQGSEIHGHSIRNGFESDVFVGTALVDMYAKCGSIKDAYQMFNKIPQRTVVTWNAMIAGYAIHGRGDDALNIFRQMNEEGMKPDSITFTGVLSACSHAGLMDEGWQYFDSMSRDYEIMPNVGHYACMVDLLGRGGYLHEAWDFIHNMPLEPDVTVWGTLLSACKIHCNVELGERVAKNLFELEPENGGNYILLLNIYALAGRQDDVVNLRDVMEDIGVQKRPGWSWICIRNKVHAFFAGDRSHPQMDKIYAKLQSLVSQMKLAGYVPGKNIVPENENILYSHSEKLAIAFGLINTGPATPIRIIKNLRVCADCHTAIKFISKIAGRELFVRDRNRFHHFKDGLCSCGDYW